MPATRIRFDRSLLKTDLFVYPIRPHVLVFANENTMKIASHAVVFRALVSSPPHTSHLKTTAWEATVKTEIFKSAAQSGDFGKRIFIVYVLTASQMETEVFENSNVAHRSSVFDLLSFVYV